MITIKPWSVSDISSPVPLSNNLLEFQADSGEYVLFELIATADRIVFGSATNAGFLESGYILRDPGESLDETLSELLADLQAYYNDGPGYAVRIVTNERM